MEMVEIKLSSSWVRIINIYLIFNVFFFLIIGLNNLSNDGKYVCAGASSLILLIIIIVNTFLKSISIQDETIIVKDFYGITKKKISLNLIKKISERSFVNIPGTNYLSIHYEKDEKSKRFLSIPNNEFYKSRLAKYVANVSV